MSVPRAVAVVGYKKAGKTRVVEAIVRELARRGFRVGTIKHASPTHSIDSPGKDTWRHREAGASASAILTSSGSAIFINQQMSLADVITKISDVDFVVIEGFKSIDTIARIIVPKEVDEIEGLANGLEIAISGPHIEGISLKKAIVPVFSSDQSGGLADLVVEKAFPLLPGLNCHGCGYRSCRELALAIVKGESDARSCVSLPTGPFKLRVDGVAIPLKPFVQDIVGNAVLGMVRALRGGENPRKIEIELDAEAERSG